MALADRLQQEQQTTETLDILTSTLPAVEQQLRDLTTAVKELRGFEVISDQETSKRLERMQERLLASITSLSVSTPVDSRKIESVESRLGEIERTLGVLARAIDGKQIAASAASIQRSTTALEKVSSSVTEVSDEHLKKVQLALHQSGRAVRQVKEQALESIRFAGSEAGVLVTARLEESIARAEDVLTVASRLQRRVTIALVGRMAIALLPIAVVLLMLVSTAWTLTNGVEWVLAMDAPLWQRIVTGVAVTGVAAGMGAGLWWLARQVRGLLRE